MANYPALMLWTDAYLGDAYHLSTEEHGAYFLMLMAAWRTKDCRLRDDDAFLARITKSTIKRWRQKLRPSMLAFWTVENGHWTQKRLLDEREKVNAICAKRSRAATTRWNSNRLNGNDTGDTHAYAHGMQPEPQPESKIRKKESDSAVGGVSGCKKYTFSECWNLWTIPGTKRGRAAAERKYVAAIKAGASHADICAGVKRYMDHCRRERTELRYIKHPATWLSGGCWDDELPLAGGGRRGETAGRSDKDAAAEARQLEGMEA